MTGPIGQMEGWQQVLIGGGLLALMLLLKQFPSRAQREVQCEANRRASFERLKRDCMHEGLSLEERLSGAQTLDSSGRALAEEPALDISRPPSWWGDLKWKPRGWR